MIMNKCDLIHTHALVLFHSRLPYSFIYDSRIHILSHVGDRSTGKSSLWRRLQGLRFNPHHEPTPQIQISHINWVYKSHEDNVKVEVWDVVDKGFVRKCSISACV